ncbi:hypothetical protein G7Y89_g9977 [Cudoniella acicularis]|uniref:Uncharacterized protein n=1 Tax=Cudoniella acicularis TaxID=354080 RepID=A0A8H4RDM6_9HELO|nr:hypothetical protein G7Y89_g9977 [Cudoniella acicularis]
MTFQLLSTQSRQYTRDETNLTPSTDRNGFQNDVPLGTVASRVNYLQSLANSTPPRLDQPYGNRRRENSRTGFGRRLNSRFGEPASRNTKPDEQTQIDTSHSFLGLRTPRKNHDEQHGIAGYRMKYDRVPGIHGQVKPQGFTQRAQYDAVSPWTTFPKVVPIQNAKKFGEEDMSVLDGMDPLEKSTHCTAQASMFPASSLQEALDAYHNDYGRHQNDTLSSQASILTTSTIRRQSVRDLYYDYGIERPARLVSSDRSRDMDYTPRPNNPHRHCHNCSWVNSSPSLRCWKCRHRFCEQCKVLSLLPTSNSRPNNYNSTNLTTGEANDVRGKSTPAGDRAIFANIVKENPGWIRPGTPAPVLAAGRRPIQSPHEISFF